MKRILFSALLGLAMLTGGAGINTASAEHGCYVPTYHHHHHHSGYRGYGGGYYNPRYVVPSYGYGYGGYYPGGYGGYSSYYRSGYPSYYHGGGHGGVVIGGYRGGIAIGW